MICGIVRVLWLMANSEQFTSSIYSKLWDRVNSDENTIANWPMKTSRCLVCSHFLPYWTFSYPFNNVFNLQMLQFLSTESWTRNMTLKAVKNAVHYVFILRECSRSSYERPCTPLSVIMFTLIILKIWYIGLCDLLIMGLTFRSAKWSTSNACCTIDLRVVHYCSPYCESIMSYTSSSGCDLFGHVHYSLIGRIDPSS